MATVAEASKHIFIVDRRFRELMAAGVLLYHLGFLDLVSLGFVFAAHFALGWIYLFLSQLFLPRISEAPQKGNPFNVKA